MRKILFVLLCSLLTAQVFGYDFKDDDSGLCFNITRDWEQPYTVEVTCENSDNYYAINYIRLTTAIIPETVSYRGETYTVTSIGGYAFYNCSGLTSVTIPNSVTSIGSYAFSGVNTIIYGGSATDEGSWSSWGAGNWGAGKRYYAVDENFAYSNTEKTIITEYIGHSSEVVIPNGVTEIGSSAFQNCTNLTSVTIPNSVTSIGNGAFDGCSGLTKVNAESIEGWLKITFNNITSNPLYYAPHLYVVDKEVTEVVIPNSVTSIGNYAFYGCSGLTSVTIPNSVTSIGYDAFCNCSGLTSVTIPNSVMSIGWYAFSGCSGLTSVTIPNSVMSIGWYAFYGCSGLTSVTIPNSVTSIGEYAFSGCSGLTSVTIPNSVTSIGYGTFSGCSGLTSVTIPNSVTSIDEYAFYGCSGLTSVTIPNSVTSIDDAAFSGCVNMTKITCNSFMPPVAVSAFEHSYEFYNKVTLTYPGEAYNLYSKMEPWCFFNVDTNAQGERVLYINRNDTVTYLDTVFVFNNDTIHSITHDTIVVVNQSITHDTTYVVSKDTVYVIGSEVKTYKITATTIHTMMGIGIGTGTYEENSQVELVAIANYGYHFTKWSDGNTNNPRFEKVTADCNYYAEFGVNNYSVMASSNNIKMGYVEGSDDYAYLSKTQLRAVPKYGYKFTGWSDGETVNPREVLVYCDTTFTALFMANDETDIDGETANGVVVYAHHNVIVVENATADIYVYDTMGRLVARKGVCEGSAQIAMPREGIYIVKCGAEVKRIYLGFRN